MSPTEIEIQSGLLRLYEGRHPRRQNVRILDLARISDGWETEVYSFAVEYSKADDRRREELILRIYPGNDAPAKSAREFNTMVQLHEMGYPVPQVLLLDSEGAHLGTPFVVMEKIAGRSLGAISDESPVERKLELLTTFCRMFVDLHALEPRPFARNSSFHETDDLSEIFRRQLSYWQSYTHALESHTFDPIFSWLDERLPTVRFGSPSLIHMDFHPYNILLREEDGAAYVIDWTSAEVSDYRLDLAWTLLLMSTYGNPESRALVLGEYERIAGHRVERIKYFEVAACLRRLFSIAVSLSSGADKLGMRPGSEAMMADGAHIERVYARLRERTGITIAEVEKLLSRLG